MTSEEITPVATDTVSGEQAAQQNGRPTSEPSFPLASLREAAPHLRRPFSPEAIKWKVQSVSKGQDNQPPTGGMVVAYIDARLVVERFNLLLPHLWSDAFVHLDAKHVRCDLTVDGIPRCDVGTFGGDDRHSDPLKAGYSDALKRAAVHFGVGVSLYALRNVWLKAGSDAGELRVIGRGPKRTLALTPRTEDWLRDKYAKWLKSEANRFGDPLDHGDVHAAIGDPDLAPEQPAENGHHEPPKPTAHSRSKQAKELDATNQRMMGELGFSETKRLATHDNHRSLAEKRQLNERLSAKLDERDARQTELG